MFIKISLRRNLLHLLYLMLWNFSRKVEGILMGLYLDYNSSLINTLLMFIGEFLAGLIIYVYQQKFLAQEIPKKQPLLLTITVRKKKEDEKKKDSIFKQYFLIFLCAYFDFVEFTLSIKSVSKFIGVSGSLEWRLTGILTITSSIFLFYVMKFKIVRHQKVSLVVLIIALGLIIATEFMVQKVNVYLSYLQFIFAIFIIFLIHFFTSLNDIIEKYLFEFDSLNQFKTLMWEGIFGIILTLIYCAYDSPFGYLVDYYHKLTTLQFSFLIVALFIYIVLSGGRNAYRVHVNKLYSPIVKTLTDYFVNPIYILYYKLRKKDFDRTEYFIINMICSLIITFFGCVYNEFIILFFCGLEFDTYEEVSKRASNLERLSKISINLNDIDIKEEEDRVTKDGYYN